MDDVITSPAPPSRFFADDLDIFSTPKPTLLPPPLLLLSPKALVPVKTLILFLSPPSRSLLPTSLPLAGTLLLPESSLAMTPFSQLTNRPSFPLYHLKDKSAIAAVVDAAVPESRAHKVAHALLSGLKPERVVVLDSVKSWNYRGRLYADEIIERKLETRAKRAKAGAEDRLFGELEYYPSGSLIDGLGAAVLASCQMRDLEGTLVAMWPEGAKAREFSALRSIAEEFGLGVGVKGGGSSGGARPPHHNSDLYT